MLFQGQETGSTRPWRYFVDHDPALDQLVRDGRAEFLAQFARLATPEAQAALPDPGDRARRSRRACSIPASAGSTRRSRSCTAICSHLRRAHPAFTDQRRHARRRGARRARVLPALVARAGDRLLLVNLGRDVPRRGPARAAARAAARARGWRLAWSSEDPRYGGHGTPEPFTVARLAIPAHAAVLCEPIDA